MGLLYKSIRAVLVGSHLDTVPQGGYFDGLTGIMAALEAVTTLSEHGERLRHPIEVVAFINEEGNEFLGGCFGSKAIAGQLPDDYAKTCFNKRNGKSMYDAMLEFGMDLDPDNIKGSVVRREDYCCFIETHVEQGRYLLDNGYPLAVVDSIAAVADHCVAVFIIILVSGKVIINRLERMAPVIIIRVDDRERSVDLIDST